MGTVVTRRDFMLAAPAATLAASGVIAAHASEHLEVPSTDVGSGSEAIDAFARRYLEVMHAPGMVIALASREGGIKTARYGYGHIATRRGIAPDELVQVGSITKSMIAIALLQLNEEGKLDLDRPVLEYLPSLRLETPHGPVTAHHLLTHTAGLPTTVALFPADPSLRHRTMYPPGKLFYYSNLGYGILGQLLASLDGRSIPESLQVRLFKPLGMTASTAIIDTGARARTVMSYVPYLRNQPYPRDGALTEAPEIVLTAASGCVSATAADMGRYVAMLANRGALADRRILTEASFERFVRPWVEAKDFGPDHFYGYGLMITRKDGRAIVRHTGGMVSFASSLVIDLDSGVGAFASVNAMQKYRPTPVAVWGVEVLRAEAAKESPGEPPALERATVVENNVDYAGVYQDGQGGSLTFEAQGDRLVLVHMDARVPVETLSVGGLLARHPDFESFMLAFRRPDGTESGPYSEVAHGGRCYARDAAALAAKPVPPVWHTFVGRYHSESSWFGTAYVVLRKGQLWTITGNGYEFPLEPTGERTFRFVDTPATADWIRFGDECNGRVACVSVSGEPYVRVADA